MVSGKAAAELSSGASPHKIFHANRVQKDRLLRWISDLRPYYQLNKFVTT